MNEEQVILRAAEIMSQEFARGHSIFAKEDPSVFSFKQAGAEMEKDLPLTSLFFQKMCSVSGTTPVYFCFFLVLVLPFQEESEKAKRK